MSKKLQKSLQEYLSKIKKQTPHLQFSHCSLSSTTSKILSGCKHPKSLSFSGNRKIDHDHDHHHHIDDPAAAATLEDIDNFLIENFKSLYGKNHDDDQNDDYEPTREDEKGKSTHELYHVGPKDDFITSLDLEGVRILYDSPRFFTPPHDLCGSHRFFVSSTSSSSLIEEAGMSGVGTSSTSASEDDEGSTSTTSTRDTGRAYPRNYMKDGDNNKPTIPGGIEDCIALLTVSPSPYEDFRKSMQEMLDARINNNQRVDWDFMEELLFCYLRLNEKKQYRYILSAFVDLVVILRQNSTK